MKRKKRFPKVMLILMLCLAIVLIILLVERKNKVEPVNTSFSRLVAPQTAGNAGQQPENEPAAQPEEQTEADPEIQVDVQPDEITEPEPETEAQDQAPAAGGTVVDTGVIRSVCPDGWLYIEQRDSYGEQDENGVYPLDPTRMCFCKGATTELDVFSKLSIYVYYRSQPYTDTTVDEGAMWYAETQRITATINGVECQGFHATEEDVFNEGEFYEYDILYLPVGDSHYFEFLIMASAPGSNDSLSANDPDVQMILSNTAAD